MNANLDDLYQQVILDHNKNPRNFRKIAACTHTAEGFNPLCGDHINLYITVTDNTITDIAFEGSGCAISTASASLMTQTLKGKTIESALSLFEHFLQLITGKAIDDQNIAFVAKLKVLGGVAKFPSRVKCAALCWHTLKSALLESKHPVSTE